MIDRIVEEPLIKSLVKHGTNGKYLIPLMVSLSNHEWNQLIQGFLNRIHKPVTNRQYMAKLLTTLKHKFFEVIPPTIFFFMAFSLIIATKRKKSFGSILARSNVACRAFFVYCAMLELVRAIGRDKVIQMFFGTPRRPLNIKSSFRYAILNPYAKDSALQ